MIPLHLAVAAMLPGSDARPRPVLHLWNGLMIESGGFLMESDPRTLIGYLLANGYAWRGSVHLGPPPPTVQGIDIADSAHPVVA